MNATADTLEEALASGRGVERPFRCPSHDDNMASASVNVLKGLWFCHACHASGHVDKSKKTDVKVEDIEAMIEPERAVREYPEAWLEMFMQPGEKYWDQRFAPWVSHYLRLGQDPITGDATFPVHTPLGKLAGVGRRHITEDKQKRYLYPRRWSASMTMFGTAGHYPHLPVLALVEGAADAASVWEVGCPALGVYGSGLHIPQIGLLVRYNPKLILLGFDMDEAGEKAVTRAFSQLSRIAPVQRVRWIGGKDPAECPPIKRAAALHNAVGRSHYGIDVVTRWDAFVAEQQQAYNRHLEEESYAI